MNKRTWGIASILILLLIPSAFGQELTNDETYTIEGTQGENEQIDIEGGSCESPYALPLNTWKTGYLDQWDIRDYWKATSKEGDIIFNVKDISSSENFNLYVYDWNCGNLLCSSTKGAGQQESCTVKDVQDGWGFQVQVTRISGWGQYNVKASMTCDEKWLDDYQCSSGDMRERKKQNQDCTVTWEDWYDCDNYDTEYGSYTDYCSGDDVRKKRTKNNGYCSTSTNNCKVVEIPDDRLVKDCNNDDGWGSFSPPYCPDADNVKKSRNYYDYTCSNARCSASITDTQEPTISFNGHNDFCEDRKDAGCSLCAYNKFDCDSDNECHADAPDCVDSDGGVCGIGDECGCCLEGDTWDTTNNKCVTPCKVTKAEWSTTSTIEGTSVNAKIETTSTCNGKTVNFEVWEKDCGYGYSSQADCVDDAVNYYPISKTVQNGIAESAWIAEWQDDDGDPEFYFVGRMGSISGRATNLLTVQQACIDSDKDGYGVYGRATCAKSGVDCKDNNANINPGATEVCDGIDNNCKNGIDEGDVCKCIIHEAKWEKSVAAEGENIKLFMTGNSQCNTKEASIVVKEWDIASDDPVISNPSKAKFIGTKAETNWIAEWQDDFPSNPPEYIYKATIDDSTYTSKDPKLSVSKLCQDSDNDGYFKQPGCGSTIDCNDADKDIYPGARELCDGKDNQCTGDSGAGQTDEGYNIGNSCSAGIGECARTGKLICSNDKQAAVCNAVPGSPSSEVCDGKDNDCDSAKDEDFDFSKDPNNCNGCGKKCESDETCIDSKCTAPDKIECGDGTCSKDEVCATDCISLEFKEPPSNIDSDKTTPIKVIVTNKGSARQNFNMEVGSTPYYWRGKITPSVVYEKANCCKENLFYDSKQVDIPGNTEWTVNFDIIPQTTTTKDSCSKDPNYEDAWDEKSKFELIAGSYEQCEAGYKQFIRKDVKINNAGPNDCTIPDGKPDCTCSSHNDCSEGDDLICDFVGKKCVEKTYQDECSEIDNFDCRNNALYRCEQGSKKKEWIYVTGCASNQACNANKQECLSLSNYDLIIDNAPPSVRVNKQPGTILKINIKTTGPLNNINLQTPEEFKHIDGPCDSNNYGTGDNICHYSIDAVANKNFKIRFGDDSQQIRTIGQDPTIAYITSKSQLEKRYNNKPAVNLLFAKLYEEALDNNGVVYDMDVQLKYLEYYNDHPFNHAFSKYDEGRIYPTMINNAYGSAVATFVGDYLSYAKNVVIVGDDYIIPHTRDFYSISAGSLPDWLRGAYNTIKANWKKTPALIPGVNWETLGIDPGDLLDEDIVVKSIYTDQPLVQRHADWSYHNMDEIFRNDESTRGNEVKFVLPEVVTPEMRTAINILKQTLKKEKLVAKESYFSELAGTSINCNSFNEFGDYWWFDPLDLPIVIGTQETNPATNCYPAYGNGEFTDVVTIEPNVWNKNGATLLMYTDDPKTVSAFATKVIHDKQYKELYGRGYMYFHDSVEVISLVLIPLTFGTSAAGSASLAGTLFYIDLTVSAFDALDTCVYRKRDNGNSGAGYWIECAASLLPVGSYGAGKVVRMAKVGKLLRVAENLGVDEALSIKKFLTSSSDADFVLRHVPSDKYDNFAQMLTKHIVAEGKDAGSKFGQNLVEVMKDASIKRGTFRNNPEMIDLIGDTVAKHPDANKKTLEQLSRVVSQKPGRAKEMLEIIQKSNNKWDELSLRILNDYDDATLRRLKTLVDDKCIGIFNIQKVTKCLNLDNIDINTLGRLVEIITPKITSVVGDMDTFLDDALKIMNGRERSEFIVDLGYTLERNGESVVNDLIELRNVKGIHRLSHSASFPNIVDGTLYEIAANKKLIAQGKEIKEISVNVPSPSNPSNRLTEIDSITVTDKTLWEFKSKSIADINPHTEEGRKFMDKMQNKYDGYGHYMNTENKIDYKRVVAFEKTPNTALKQALEDQGWEVTEL